ncbi:MaoC family dehydratase N-terminal domain-containing protein [Porphyrobacter sp. ULC335]|uniref:FAS1-like dehydratase domain-containing protein n=1 Tax=Porphyrobacter sp. ULC335 TaxID=2854260 RepID=UPI0022210998|nr:MaoC family dehydratase N-terminal domain-containing protein [Porphyrobacter sp. ULC335]UYV16431.1 MaoC family dehydratase N-terminal domain-containing protein [Porphyrobacter sp. ULC335]
MNFEAWIGRETRAKDRLDEGLADRWLATFDLARPHPAIMPQGIHFALCAPEAPTAKLGEDGHPARDDSPDSFLPPFPMPRRMWASSKIAFHAPIAIGAVIERVSKVASVSEKAGGSGRLAFVDIEHVTKANGTLAVIESQTLVYRDAASADAPLSPPPLAEGRFDPAGWDAHRALTPDARLLFRYSALTFNTHRIHYDTPYASEVERYRGLVVHGPLTASLLLQLAATELGENRLRSFQFRGLSPAIAGEPLHLVMRKSEGGYELAAFADDGRQVTAASAAV